MIYDSIDQLIGNTPLLLIPTEVHSLQHIDVYAKLEYFNPFGSLKDRVAWAMLREILPEARAGNRTVVESSSGNTAKALAALCGIHNVDFLTVTSRIRYPEVRMILQLFGATIEELPAVSECPDPYDPDDFLAVAKNLVKSAPEKYVLTDQYFNPANPASHYTGTAEEILADLGKVDYFTSFLGTCGSTSGIGTRLREHNPETAVYGVVSAPGNVVPGGRMSNELWEVGFFNKEFYTDLLEGDIDQAIDGMLTLNRRCGLSAGPTSGLTYHAMVQRLRTEDHRLGQLGQRANAVFIACDRMEPYTSFVQRHRPTLFNPAASIAAGRGTAATSKPSLRQLNPADIAACPTISCEQLRHELETDPRLLVMDIRGHFAFSVGHIPASMNIVDEQLGLLIEQGPILGQRPVVLVCPIGEHSRRYAAFLRGQGCPARSLQGGLNAWREAGFDLHTTPTSASPQPGQSA